MTVTKYICAGLVAMGVWSGIPAVAEAQPRWDHGRGEHRGWDHGRGGPRGHVYGRGYGGYGGRGYYPPPPVYYAPRPRPYYPPPGIFIPFR